MELIQWIGGIAAAVLFTVLVRDPLQFIAARFLSGIWPGSSVSLKGIWNSNYSYINSNGVHTEKNRLMKVTQFGNHIVAGNTDKNDNHIHDITARLHNGIVTGT